MNERNGVATTRIRSFILVTLQTMLIFLFLYVSYLAFYPFVPIRVDRIEVYEKDVKRGEVIHFRVIGHKYMAVPTNITIELVNSERLLVMSYFSNQPVGTEFPLRSFVVPKHILPGWYYIEWTGRYIVNQFQTVLVRGRSDLIYIG